MKKKNKVAMAQLSFPLNKLAFTQVIQELLHANIGFVCFKKPNESDVYCLIDENEAGAFTFLFQSFDSLSSYNIQSSSIYKNAEILDVKINSKYKIVSKVPTSNAYYQNKEAYENYVASIIQEIKIGNLQKCVAARKMKLSLPTHFNAVNAWINLFELYSNAFVYLANTSLGLWMGASPELLLKNTGNLYQTVSLAGTKLANENRAWTKKEYEEQDYVTQYILENLNKHGAENIQISDVYSTQAGHLSHLKTDLQFTIRNHIDLLKSLHPTPAVGGIPLLNAKAFIQQFEQNQRKLYSGFLGLQTADSFYYVNLRCMQIFENYADIHIGAGITLNSEPNKEWQETENKAKTMEKILE